MKTSRQLVHAAGVTVLALILTVSTVRAAVNIGNTITVSGAYDLLVAAGRGLDVASAGALTVGGTTATSVTIGRAGATGVTVTTDGTGTAEVALPAGSIDGTEILNGTVALADLEAASLDGTAVKTLTEGAVIGAIPLTYVIDVPNAATADYDITVTHKIRVLDAYVIKTGGNGDFGDTITVKNGANAITGDFDLAAPGGADTAVIRAGQINDAYYEIAAAGTLRVSVVKASVANVAAKVIVTAVRVP